MILWTGGNVGILFLSRRSAPLILALVAYMRRAVAQEAGATRAAAYSAAAHAILSMAWAAVLSWPGEAGVVRRVALEATVCRVVNWEG
jgi:hypothetical protein